MTQTATIPAHISSSFPTRDRQIPSASIESSQKLPDDPKRVRNHHRNNTISYCSDSFYSNGKDLPGQPDRSGRTDQAKSSSVDSRSTSVPAHSRFRATVEDDNDDDDDYPTMSSRVKKSPKSPKTSKTHKSSKTAPKEPSPLKQSTTPPGVPTVPEMSAQPDQPTAQPVAQPPPGPISGAAPAPAFNVFDFLTPDEEGPAPEPTPSPLSDPSVDAMPGAVPASFSSVPPSAAPSSAPTPAGGLSPVPSLAHSDASFRTGGNLQPSYAPSEYAYASNIASPASYSPNMSPQMGGIPPHSPTECDSIAYNVPPGQTGPPPYNYIHSPNMNPPGMYQTKPPEPKAISRIKGNTPVRSAVPQPPPNWPTSQGNSPNMGPGAVVPYQTTQMGAPQGPISPHMLPYQPAPNAPHVFQGPPQFNLYGQQIPFPQMAGFPPMAQMMPPAQNAQFNQPPQNRPALALEAPTGPSTKTVVGYELLASSMSTSGPSTEVEGEGELIQPLYRRFDALNHRVLLHIQDEVAEMEEQLRNLDEQCAAFLPQKPKSNEEEEEGNDEKQFTPCSRRLESQNGNELHKQRTALLGRIYIKVNQYSTALESYKRCQRSFGCDRSDIEHYKSFLERRNPIVASETRFLENEKDLMLLSHSKSISGHSDQASQIKVSLPFIGPKSTDLPSILFFMLLFMAGLSMVLALGIFALVAIVISSYSSVVPFFFIGVSVVSAFVISKVVSTIVALDRQGLLSTTEDKEKSLVFRVLQLLKNGTLALVTKAKTLKPEVPAKVEREQKEAIQAGSTFNPATSPLATSNESVISPARSGPGVPANFNLAANGPTQPANMYPPQPGFPNAPPAPPPVMRPMYPQQMNGMRPPQMGMPNGMRPPQYPPGGFTKQPMNAPNMLPNGGRPIQAAPLYNVNMAPIQAPAQ